MDNTIHWIPQHDNIIEGSAGDIKLYIRLKKVDSIELGKREKEIVDSLYIINRTGTEKVMAHEHEAYTVEDMKIVAKILLESRH